MIKMYDRIATPLGFDREALPASTTFVTCEAGMHYRNPTITESDGADVIFVDNGGSERIGTAVTIATMTPKEALWVARRCLHHIVTINGVTFEWHKRRSEGPVWCVHFTKPRGFRTFLLPVDDMDTCLDLAEGRKKVVWSSASKEARIIRK